MLHDVKMLILASQSPRRKEILTNAGFDFAIRAADVDESIEGTESPREYVCRLARKKALAVPMNTGEIVLGADTTVVVDNEILAKPEDAADARRMIGLLSGRNHTVITGICLRHAHGEIVDAETTLVHFSALSEDEIAAYAASGQPMDKAGAYGIQGLASKYIDRIEGCYFNIVGLPISMVWRHLRTLE
jgi:septum formation protein